MVAVFPAVGVSLVLVFVAGVYFTGVILEQFSKDIKKYPRFYGKAINKFESYLTESAKQKISLIGGGIAIGLLILLIINIPAEWRSIIWYGLTAIGIVVGVSTFLNRSEG